LCEVPLTNICDVAGSCGGGVADRADLENPGRAVLAVARACMSTDMAKQGATAVSK
jgi:hypothetical protein